MTSEKLRDRVPVESEAGEDPSAYPPPPCPPPCPSRPTNRTMIRVEHAIRPHRPNHQGKVWTPGTRAVTTLSTLSTPSIPIFLI